jgi:DNA (cytosine-5)-methyltransferase 1
VTGLRTGSLCTGYAGLDMAVHAVLGGELTWVADTDPGAAAILEHRFPGVPNLGDITQVDWESVEPVDVWTAGFPCQPVSAAGRRRGVTDERWLFDDICTAVGRMVPRPRLLVFENVPGLLSANGGDAMARVVQGVAALGYEFTYRLVRASDAGAPHRRERWFCLAWPAEDADSATGGEWRLSAPGRAPRGGAWPDAGGPGGARVAADADRTGEGRPERPARGHEPGRRPSGGGPVPPDAECEGRQGTGHAGKARGQVAAGNTLGRVLDWGAYGPAVARWEAVLGRSAPRPTVPGKTAERLNPRFVEWMQGLPEGWVTDVPGLSRNAMLKALGNGVVPAQAELALRLLLEHAESAEVGDAA